LPNLAAAPVQVGHDGRPTWTIPLSKLGAFNHQAGWAAFISHMALTIRAMRNNLGTSESPFYALASWSEVVDSEKFIDRMAAGRTTLSKTDIIAVFQLAREELARLLSEGCYVKTPLGAALLVATGKFSQPRDPFLPNSPDSGHALRIDFRIDRKIEKEALASIQCVRDKAGDRRSPNLLAFEALPSDSHAEAEVGDVVRISGSRLKFDPADRRLGLFLEDETGIETRSEVYIQVRPSSLIALVPTGAKEGSYRLIVRTVSKGGEILEGSATERIRILARP